ncbi:hypothetical protein AAHT65_19150 [Bacillus atrophaeus]|uniref:hypothetical protein n=1 Tax=Bacillus atrophaeus TaxID=1452 RepID=UPI0031BB0316
MSKSSAKKKRAHLLRNGGQDASLSRGLAPSFSTHVRKTKSKKDRLERSRYKGRNPYDRYLDNHKDFLCA